MWNRLAPTHMWQIKIGRGISAAEVPPRGQGIQDPHQAPHLRVPVPGREIPITLGCKNHEELMLREMRVAGV